MKLKNFFQLFLLIGFAIVFQARSGGPGTVAALEVTGAPGSVGDVGTCGNSGCHTSGSFEPTLELKVDNGDYMPLSMYTPGESYFFTIDFTAGSGTIAATGFQAVALDDSDANVGTWSNIPSAVQISNMSNRNYIEHNAPTNETQWEAEWTAPAEGAGDITFYVAGIASNLNGNNQGDGVASSTITISEILPSSTSKIDSDFATINVAPNPIVDITNLSIVSKTSGLFQINIINKIGQRIHEESINLQVGQNNKMLRLGDLNSGVYFLQIVGEKGMSSQQIIKL